MIFPLEDKEFRSGFVAEVKDGAFKSDDGWWLGFRDFTPAPTVGTVYHIFGRGIGYTVRGLFFNGIEVFYRTEEQDAEHHRNELKDLDAKRRAEFEVNRADLDAQFEELPYMFQRRIEKFRRNNPDFRWKYEGYEMFVCGEAVRIAQEFEVVEEIQKFGAMSYEEQQHEFTMAPGHSGNTFGAALHLAMLYVTDEALVEQMHGALAPLVGSKEYGGI